MCSRLCCMKWRDGESMRIWGRVGLTHSFVLVELFSVGVNSVGEEKYFSLYFLGSQLRPL